MCIILAIIVIFYLIFPGRNYDTEKLRKAYVDTLMNYEGTRYVWGGENKLGIDCSGLVRQGLIYANIKIGILEINPDLIREGILLWWYDCSAKALLDGYRQKTRLLASAQSINELDHSILLLGDIAVTSDGIHVLAFVGDSTWIEADPYEKKTIKVRVPVKNNFWFKVPIHILRWCQLINN